MAGARAAEAPRARAHTLTPHPPPRARRSFLDGTLREEDIWANWDPRKMEARVEAARRAELDSGELTPETARIEALLAQLAAPRGSAAHAEARAAAARLAPAAAKLQ
jgi:hypothetical protein